MRPQMSYYGTLELKDFKKCKSYNPNLRKFTLDEQDQVEIWLLDETEDELLLTAIWFLHNFTNENVTPSSTTLSQILKNLLDQKKNVKHLLTLLEYLSYTIDLHSSDYFRQYWLDKNSPAFNLDEIPESASNSRKSRNLNNVYSLKNFGNLNMVQFLELIYRNIQNEEEDYTEKNFLNYKLIKFLIKFLKTDLSTRDNAKSSIIFQCNSSLESLMLLAISMLKNGSEEGLEICQEIIYMLSMLSFSNALDVNKFVEMLVRFTRELDLQLIINFSNTIISPVMKFMFCDLFLTSEICTLRKSGKAKATNSFDFSWQKIHLVHLNAIVRRTDDSNSESENSTPKKEENANNISLCSLSPILELQTTFEPRFITVIKQNFKYLHVIQSLLNSKIDIYNSNKLSENFDFKLLKKYYSTTNEKLEEVEDIGSGEFSKVFFANLNKNGIFLKSLEEKKILEMFKNLTFCLEYYLKSCVEMF
ncbi:hypothetical protein HDU92_000214 [Lobulomyces angularis]|nr:hypothetical protein HDU92_000214 [Lobulomyces angularis]